MNIRKYRKLVVAVIGLGLIYIKERSGVDLGSADVAFDTIVSIGTAFGVFQATNEG